MNNMIKAGLLTVGLGLTLQASDANAGIANYTSFSNAVNYCQAFTPGPSNTIRNRVIGSQNIGAPIAVACNFQTMINGAPGSTTLQRINLSFSNGAAAAATVSCTLLTGTSAGIGGGANYAVTKSVVVHPGSASGITFATADNPTPGATDLGHVLVGVNCTLPTNMTMSMIQLTGTADNGV